MRVDRSSGWLEESTRNSGTSPDRREPGEVGHSGVPDWCRGQWTEHKAPSQNGPNRIRELRGKAWMINIIFEGRGSGLCVIKMHGHAGGNGNPPEMVLLLSISFVRWARVSGKHSIWHWCGVIIANNKFENNHNLLQFYLLCFIFVVFIIVNHIQGKWTQCRKTSRIFF